MSFRMKLNGMFLGLLLAFMVISSLIIYFVSQHLIIDNVKLSNESELSINLETMEDSIYKSKEKFQLFMDDFQFTLDSDIQDDNTLLRKAFDFNSELRTFLYSNKEFKGIFLYQNQVLMGTSLANEVISYTDTMEERAAGQSIQEYLWTQLKEDWKYGQSDFFEENLFIAPLQDGAYMIAVLDYQKLIDQSDLGLIKLNAKNQVIYGDQQKIKELFNNHIIESVGPDSGAMVTSRFENQIVSIKNKQGDRYILLRDMSQIDRSIDRIVRNLVGYGLIIFIVFAAISHVATGWILKPVYDFIHKLKQVKGFEQRESIHRYIATYQEHSSAYKKLFLFFSMMIIPTLCMILISYHQFDRMIEENSRQDHIRIFKQTATNIENNLQSYHSYMRYLTLNGEFQELMMKENGDSLPRNREFADILIRKGIIDKSLSYISIYDADNRLVFSNAKNKPAMEPRQPLLVMKKEIKYLGNTVDKSNLFKYMGYIEFGINGVLDNQLHTNRMSAVILMNRDSGSGRFQTISSPIDHPYMEYMEAHIPDMTGEPIDHQYITVKGQKTLFSTIPIVMEQEKWNLGLFAPASWEEQQYIFILLYSFEVFCMLCIIIIASTLLGKRMTAPVRRAIHLMEAYPHDQSIRLRGTEHDFEFVVLAHNFNHMLSRLETLSMELMTKKNENLEMEKRINKLLFKALQSQIKPHFLQNIFTSILLLLKTGKPEEASMMLVATAKFLKTGLSGSRDLITLEEELEHVHNYVQLQSIRFERQLAFHVDVDAACYKVLLPKFIFQPLVENAIHHAMEKNRLLTVKISGAVDNKDLIIIIEDDGKGMDTEQLASTLITMNNKTQSIHCGLSNVHERLSLEFGEGYGLELKSVKGTGTQIRMKISLQKELEP
ncbi:cache domain-containing sensor histidine kinase [Paenibacillus doosanensis]|uniref:cache domain-containing sensor histidine kinase n=1 Tax=Paenibacillus doosanensis TaxID=1229154 RepID=UPI0021803331|nr:histidine kinase [Paenibacillus doosanensis]